MERIRDRLWRWLAAAGISALAACAAAPEALLTDLRGEAVRDGFEPQIRQTSTYGLFGLNRFRRDAAATGEPILHLYLEGDGFAWRRPSRPSDNPTPRNPVAMALARRDPAPLVAYLARPCQFRDLAQEPLCRPSVWTLDRYAPAEIQAVREAVDRIKAESGAARIGLNGFSGAGAILAVLAAERDDVAYLRTIAGNLEPTAFTAHHRVTPLKRPANAAAALRRLAQLPQTHLVGGSDRIVPPGLTRSVLEQAGLMSAARGCVAFQILDGVDHAGPWPLDADALSRRPRCADP